MLQRHASDPTRVRLKLSESLLPKNIKHPAATMSAMKDAGIQFSMDDFGTGNSSARYLMRLPPDRFKIDI